MFHWMWMWMWIHMCLKDVLAGDIFNTYFTWKGRTGQNQGFNFNFITWFIEDLPWIVQHVTQFFTVVFKVSILQAVHQVKIS